MLKIDFRQYQQIRRISEHGRNAVMCISPRSESNMLSARREAANLLSRVIGNDCAGKMSDSGDIGRNITGFVQCL